VRDGLGDPDHTKSRKIEHDPDLADDNHNSAHTGGIAMRASLRIRPRYVFLVCILLGAAANVYGQDIFRQVDELRSQVEALKREVTSLRNMLDALRVPALQPAGPAGSRSLLSVTPPAAEKSLDKEAVKSLACEPLRRFVAEADDALRSNELAAAQARMESAQAALRSALKPYSNDKEIQRILGISDAVAWDTTTAIELRDSVEGNTEFLDALAQYKRRFTRFCGEK